MARYYASPAKPAQPLTKQIMEATLPVTYQDVLLIFVYVSGVQDGQIMRENYVDTIYKQESISRKLQTGSYRQEIRGKLGSEIQFTNAVSASGVLDLLATDRIYSLLENTMQRFYQTGRYSATISLTIALATDCEHLF